MKLGNALVLKILVGLGFYLLLILMPGFSTSSLSQNNNDSNKSSSMNSITEKIVLGGGCFWCIEAVFENFKGVQKVVSGYAGGTEANPNYELVGAGKTSHAEVVQVEFDPKVISLEQILNIFFHAHDPTTKDAQGNDRGPQYRSIILYNSELQKKLANKIFEEITQKQLWGNKQLTTEIAQLTQFYTAEEYHQSYFKRNPNQGYCLLVIAPKVKKIKQEFKGLLR